MTLVVAAIFLFVAGQSYENDAVCGISDPAGITETQRTCLDEIAREFIGDPSTLLEPDPLDISDWFPVAERHTCHVRRLEPVWPIDDEGLPIELSGQFDVQLRYDVSDDLRSENVSVLDTESNEEMSLAERELFHRAAIAAVATYTFCHEQGGLTDQRVVLQFRSLD